MRRSGMPGASGKIGWVRSSAWIWLFSSTHNTMALSGMALTLVEARDPASVHVDEPVGEAFSTRGKVWAVAFAFVARYVRADDRPCIERLMRTAAGDHSCCKVLAPPTLSTVAPCA